MRTAARATTTASSPSAAADWEPPVADRTRSVNGSVRETGDGPDRRSRRVSVDAALSSDGEAAANPDATRDTASGGGGPHASSSSSAPASPASPASTVSTMATGASPGASLSDEDLAILFAPGAYSEIARDAQLSVSHVSRVLRGYSRPSLDVASRIAKAAGIPLDRLTAYLDVRRASPIRALPRRSPVDNPNAKLDADKAREIRAKREQGETPSELAVEYGVSEQAISDVLRNISYPE